MQALPFTTKDKHQSTIDEFDGSSQLISNEHKTAVPISNKKNKKVKSGEDLVISDPIYYTIDSYKNPPKQQLGRNCVSLENLNGIDSIKNDLTVYGNNLLQNYPHSAYQWPPFITYHPNIQSYPVQYYHHQRQPQQQQRQQHIAHFNGFNPYMNSSNNSRQSLESDDYRKYRDVAL